MKLLNKTKKELGFIGVFALSTGAVLSSGFFLLPSLAAQMAGPAVILSYLIAGLLLIPPMLCKIELGTAMPKSGGVYYFLDRSLGPMIGTIGGCGIWLALLLKASFALVGMSAYLQIFAPSSMGDSWFTIIALILLILFTGLNILGAKKTAMMQIVFVSILLILLFWFLAIGSIDIVNNYDVKSQNFDNFFKSPSGSGNFLAAAGLVFLSYAGITKVISVAGEIKNPERNLPLGLFMSIGMAIIIYVVGLTVMVGVSGVGYGEGGFITTDAAGMQANYTPVATVASQITGSNTGLYIMGFAGILGFLAVANAGILSASRYPLAMSKDHLLPSFLNQVDKKGTPTVGILVSSTLIGLCIIFLDPLKIAKLASAFQLLMFALLCLSVIVMRETKLDSYDPGFRTPFYPWLQLIGASSCIAIIFIMGWLPVIFSAGIVIAGIIWYLAYGQKRVDRYGAIYHIFERLGRKRFAALDIELRGILKEKGLRKHDPFDEIVATAQFVEASKGSTFKSIVNQASSDLSSLVPVTAQSLEEGFLHGTKVGATPVTGGVALPHLRVDGIQQPLIVIVRSKDGITIDMSDAFGEQHEKESIHAIFFLVSPEDDPSQHLRLLAQLAGHVEQEKFMSTWLDAKNGQELKEILLRDDHFVSLHIQKGMPAGSLVDAPIYSLGFPEGCLVVLVHRRGHMVVPRGSTILEEGDQLTIIGDERGIRALKQQFDMT